MAVMLAVKYLIGGETRRSASGFVSLYANPPGFESDRVSSVDTIRDSSQRWRTLFSLIDGLGKEFRTQKCRVICRRDRAKSSTASAATKCF
jgi:hypothetical protein